MNMARNEIDINLDGYEHYNHEFIFTLKFRAIMDAALQFSNSTLHRFDSRRVIMIMASTVR